MHLTTRLLTGLTVTSLAVALAACSTDQGPAEGSDATRTGTLQTDPGTAAGSTAEETGAAPSGAAPAALRPGEEVPEGMDVHDVKVFQVAIPSGWTPEQPDDEPTLSFWGEDEDGAPAEGAIVAWDPQGTSARGAAEDFVGQLEADGRRPTLELLEWPDVPEGGAYLVTFDDELAPGAQRHGQQIFAELPQGGLATVLGFATPDDYADSAVPRVLASFRVAP